MKTTIIFSIFCLFFFSAQISLGQVQEKSSNSLGGNNGTKAQDHNSTRSNKSSIQAPDFGPNEKDTVTGSAKSNQGKPKSNVSGGVDQVKGLDERKGYQYYKAKSDVSSPDASSKAQDHNSTRSNKTASGVAPNSNTGGENSNPAGKTTNQNQNGSKQTIESESEKK
jgi:hypothetical protein